jgi:hypothetical protein
MHASKDLMWWMEDEIFWVGMGSKHTLKEKQWAGGPHRHVHTAMQGPVHAVQQLLGVGCLCPDTVTLLLFSLLSSASTIVSVFWHCYCNSNFWFCFQFKKKKRIVVSAVWSGRVYQQHQLPHQPTNPTFVLGQVRIIPTSAKLEMFPIEFGRARTAR